MSKTYAETKYKFLELKVGHTIGSEEKTPLPFIAVEKRSELARFPTYIFYYRYIYIYK